MAKKPGNKIIEPSKKTVLNNTTVSNEGSKSNILGKYYSYLINFWIFIPAVIYFTVVNKYIVNIPCLDDYNAVLEFLTKFKTTSGIDKWALLFSQHADHRILHSRIIYVLYYYIFGKINFIHIILIANFQLVIIFFILTRFIKKAIPKYWNIISLVVGFCLFDLSSYENADFAMCGLQNYGVIMLFLISLYLFNLDGRKFIVLATLFEVICLFSSGNGLICALCITIFLVFKREKIKYIASGCVFLVCSPLYYFHYTKSTAMGSVSEVFASMRDTRFFFHMLGSHFSYENGILIGVVVLGALLLMFPANLKLKFKPETLPFFCVLLALFGTVITISIFRSSAGEIASYWSRYIVYSHIIVAILFVFVCIKFEGKKPFWYLGAVGVVVLLFAYKSNYEYGENMLEMTKKRLEYYPYYYGSHSPADMNTAKAIETEACKQGIYCIQDER